MFIIAQDSDKEVVILDCIQRFFSNHHVGDLREKCMERATLQLLDRKR